MKFSPLSPERWAEVAERLPVPFWMTGEDGKVIVCNARARDLGGGEVELPDNLRKVFEEGRGGGEIAMREGGREVFFAPELEKLSGGATVITLRDVTRTRWLDEADSDLVAVISHEVKTPLTGIRMALHLLAEQKIGKMNERQCGVVATARAECERLLVILNELLGLGKREGD